VLLIDPLNILDELPGGSRPTLKIPSVKEAWLTEFVALVIPED
jgi:hypothetical protein